MEQLNQIVKSEAKLPDFASTLASVNYGGYQGPTPSPADSGVMSPMTPLSSYTHGSTPEQAFRNSPEHLAYNFADEGIGLSSNYYDNNVSSQSTFDQWTCPLNTVRINSKQTRK